MARHYSTRHFFRQMPNALLARYFERHGLFAELDIPAMKETRTEALFEAWLVLPEEQRKTLDGEFQDIFEMSCEKGFRAIIDELTWQLQDEPPALDAFVATLAALPNDYHRAMLTFLDHGECWKGATRFYHADSLLYWRKRKNLGHRPAAVDPASVERLANLIRSYFHHSEGRGNNCRVEPLRRGELDYFFAYPEDYSRQEIEWVDGEFDRRPHNPAFEVIFVYCQREGTLDLNFRGSRLAVEPLQGMFADAILKLEELPPDPKDTRVYDLDLLGQRGVNFVYSPGSGIQDVEVRKLRLSSRVNKGERLTLEASTYGDRDAVYELLERIGKAMPLRQYHVTQVELVATLLLDVDKPPKRVPIRIGHPNSCSLKYDETGLKLREMLEASGIEPKEPAPEDDAEKEGAALSLVAEA